MVLIFYFFSLGYSQETFITNGLLTEKYESTHGLPFENGYNIFQDKKGFIWVQMSSGLYKYDGYSFKNIAPKQDSIIDVKKLGTRFTTFFVDSKNDIWFGNENIKESSLGKFDQKLGKFTFYPNHTDSTRFVVEGKVNAITEDHTGAIWIGTDKGLTRAVFSIDSLTLKEKIQTKHFTAPQKADRETRDSILGNYILSLFTDEEGIIWVGSIKGLTKVEFTVSSDSTNYYFKHYTRFINDTNTKGVAHIKKEKNGKLWMTTWKTIGKKKYMYIVGKFDPTTEIFRAFKDVIPENVTITSMVESKSGTLWLGTLDGLYSISPPFRHDPNMYSPLEGKVKKYDFMDLGVGDMIRAVMEDHSGVVWVVHYVGVYKLNPTVNQFNYRELEVLPQQPTPYPQSVLEDHLGNIWIACAGGGLYRFDSEMNKSDRYYHDPDNTTSLLSNDVWGIFEDSKNRLWIGTSKGLSLFKPGSNSFTHFNDLPNSPKANIFRFWQDSKEILWIGTWGEGLCFFNPQTNEFVHHEWSAENNKFQPGIKIINQIYQDKEGTVWLSTMNGLFKCSNLSENYDDLQKLSFQRIDLPTSNFLGVHNDKKGRFWVLSRHLYLLDRSSGNFKVFSKHEGTPMLYAYRIIEDQKGNFWLPDVEGIINFNPDNNTSIFYEKDYCIGMGGLMRHGGIMNSKGEIVIPASQEGIYFFHPDSIQPNLVVPKVWITDFKLFNQSITPGKQSILNKDISETQQISLRHYQNNISFEYVGLQYDQPSANQYKYKLENLEKDWVDAGSRRIASYPSLNSGKYTFQVLASNRNGNWSEEGAAIDITILPPWWQTKFACFIYFLALIGLIYGLIRWRTLEQRKKLTGKEKELKHERQVTSRLKQVDKLKDQFLANTSHELRTPLNGIIGLSESLSDRIDHKDQKEDLSMIISSGKRLTNLVNDILDFSKLRNQDLSLQLRPVDLHAAVDVVLTLSRPLVKYKEIQLINEVPENVPLADADENRIQQILHNLIGNAIKFTESGFVKIGVRNFENEGKDKNQSTASLLHVFVEDSGIGIPEGRFEAIFQVFEQADGSTARHFGGAGLGLSITRQLVKLHGGNVEVESILGKGSTFTFSLPISQTTRTQVPELKTATGTESRIASLQQDRFTFSESELTSTKGILPPVIKGEIAKILIVDDEPVNLQVLYNHLSLEGYMVTKASNGTKALKILDKEKDFDLIILDIMMPGMSGYEVCKKLRDVYMPSELPIVMLTAKNRVVDLVEGFNAGANDYLTKPFSKDELLSRIKIHLRLHRINHAAGKFVPFEFLHSIGRENITEVLLGDHTQKEVTVLFSDIRGYTSLSENMTPEENFKFINTLNGRMGPVIRQQDGFINQYLGDAIMAIFPNNPEDALISAIRMQKTLKTLNKERTETGKEPIGIGIGFHTGSLIMGIIGDENRMDAASIADAVNTASRIEGLTKHYGANILMSEKSVSKIRGNDCKDTRDSNGKFDPLIGSSGKQYHVRYVGKVKVKGKNESLGIYECFDGDSPETIEKKLATLSIFQRGLEYYFNKDFARASVSFQDILDMNPTDAVVRHFLDKSAKYLGSGVAEDWTGVEMMDFK
ncbi:MAG: response regulator [Bacteroidetes bacterium]|nr:response regulator [Bacteroidota bacterium]